MPTKVVEAPHAEVVERARRALSDHGFAVQCEIDIASKIREKTGRDLPAIVVLGACNPELAWQALSADPRVGVFLPCNVVIRDLGEGRMQVEAVDAEAMGRLFEADGLDPVAGEVARRLEAVVEAI